MVTIDTNICLVCGGCIDLCPKTAIKMVDDRVIIIPEKCVECKIAFRYARSGHRSLWKIRSTRKTGEKRHNGTRQLQFSGRQVYGRCSTHNR